MRPVIHSQKHYVQITRSAALTVARNLEDLIIAVAPSDKNLVDEVVEGAIVKNVYVELWTLNEGNDGSEIVVLCKATSGDQGPTYTEMLSLGTYNQKKTIFFTHQGLSSNDGIGNPINVMRSWYKIPKSKQRFGLGDKLVLCIANSGANSLDYCGFATYKEYT